MKSRLLGIASIFCSVYSALMIITLIVMPYFVEMEGEIPVALRPVVIVALILLFLSVCGAWVFIIYYISHVTKQEHLSTRTKVKWVCLLWFLNIFVIPFYWMKYLREVNVEAD